MNPYIDVNLGGNAAKLSVQPIYQYDHGRKLRLQGLDTTKSIMIQYAFYGMTES